MRSRCLLVSLCLILAFPIASSATADEHLAAEPGCAVPLIGQQLLDERGSWDPLSACPGIRPGGALVQRRADGQLETVYCSMGFVVTDGTNVFVTTAGHCTLKEYGVPQLGERVRAHGVSGTFGEIVYTWCEGEGINGGCGAGQDFALIRIDGDKLGHVSRAMCGWGAPSGIFRSHDEEPRELRHFGWGLGVGGTGVGVRTEDGTIQPGNPATQARRSLGRDFSRVRSASGIGAAASGDSGSGVLVTDLPELPSTDQSAQRALGIITHLAGPSMVIQRLDHSLSKAGADMGKTFTLWNP